MKKYILLLDLSGKDQVAALAADGKLIASRNWQHSPAHPADPLVKIDQLLKANKIVPQKLEGVIFNQGPGGFTSLRHASAIVNSFKLALKVKIAAVNHFEVLAQMAHLKNGWVVIPADNDNFFAARLRRGKMQKPQILKLSELPEKYLLPPNNKREELLALLFVGKKRLRQTNQVLTPLYVRQPNITRPKKS
jgi:tRNA threonylcarbamoyl adenosine modification protein YeaZ